MNPVPLLLFLPRTLPPELVRQLHPIATDRNPATVKQVSPSRGNGFVRRRVYRIPHPLPLPFKLLCSSRDVEEKGDKNQGDISRIDVHAGLEDRSRLILSVLSDAESSGREKGESYARVGLVKGIRIEIRSIDARLVSFDDSFSFCFSPFAIVPDNFIKWNCACCSNWNGCLLIFWMLASAKRSKSFKIFLSLRVF